MSDEISAFLAAGRARTFAQFRSAFETYAVSAQNMLYADKAGHVGHVLAYRQPIRPDEGNTNLLQPKSNAWTGFRKPTDLPALFDPPSGFLASANNKPFETRSPLAWFYQSSDRVNRLSSLAQSKKRITVGDVKEWQHDIVSTGSLALARDLTARVKETDFRHEDERALWKSLSTWDGHYAKEERGALAYEIVAARVRKAFALAAHGTEELAALRMRTSGWKDSLLKEIKVSKTDVVRARIMAAVTDGASEFARFPDWGSKHRYRPQHPLGSIPVIGRRFRFPDFPADGGSDTIMKTASNDEPGVGYVSFGANARHVSDLSDPDANWFLLNGGQDGWMTTEHTTDQIALWKRHELIQVPLSDAGIEKTFTRVLTLTSKAK